MPLYFGFEKFFDYLITIDTRNFYSAPLRHLATIGNDVDLLYTELSLQLWDWDA